MKIGYYLHWDLSRESGVLKKVMAQIRSWQNLGANVQLFAISHQLPICPELAEFSITVLPNGSYLTRNHQVFKLTKKILDWKPDIVYTRFATYYPALEILMKKIPVVMEVNTDDRAENRLAHSGLRNLYHSITRTRLLSGAKGLVFVTHELAQRFAWNGPQTVVANGISLDDIPCAAPVHNTTPRLVFLGQSMSVDKNKPADWHGLDRLERLAENCPDWRFDIIGLNADQFTRPLNNVLFHGHMKASDYSSIVALSDIGIGSLAFHRISIFEASPLKVREYLAYGLPVIIAYTDTDFMHGAPFLHQLPPDDTLTAQQISAVRRFVHAWLGQRVNREAIAHLDWQTKERERIAFFYRILNL